MNANESKRPPTRAPSNSRRSSTTSERAPIEKEELETTLTVDLTTNLETHDALEKGDDVPQNPTRVASIRADEADPAPKAAKSMPRRLTATEKGKQRAAAIIEPRPPKAGPKISGARKGTERKAFPDVQPVPSILEILSSIPKDDVPGKQTGESSTSVAGRDFTSSEASVNSSPEIPVNFVLPKIDIKDKRMISTWFFSALSQSSLAGVVGLSVVSNEDLKDLAQKMPYGTFIGMVALGFLYSMSSTLSITEKRAWKNSVIARNAAKAKIFKETSAGTGKQHAKLLLQFNSLSLDKIDILNGLSSGATASLGSLAAGLASSRSLTQLGMGLTGYGLSLALLSIDAWRKAKAKDKKLRASDAEGKPHSLSEDHQQAQAKIKEMVAWLTDVSAKSQAHSTNAFISMAEEKEVTSIEVWDSAMLSGVSLIMCRS